MLFGVYIRWVSLGAFFATVLLVAATAGLLTDEQLAAAYAPAVWACYRLPLFVTEHEQWIEVFALLRVVWRMLHPLI
ncbi:MAG TPA: hypothetical protein VM165_19955 [Planctomycetaceae bacterium]|nr:hypothetical protein [Planctomycetaceae bacterium]